MGRSDLGNLIIHIHNPVWIESLAPGCANNMQYCGVGNMGAVYGSTRPRP